MSDKPPYIACDLDFGTTSMFVNAFLKAKVVGLRKKKNKKRLTVS